MLILSSAASLKRHQNHINISPLFVFIAMPTFLNFYTLHTTHNAPSKHRVKIECKREDKILRKKNRHKYDVCHSDGSMVQRPSQLHVLQSY